MEITAAAVKELRERTGAGMMDCKRALAEAEGNLDEAIKILRTKGLAAAAKKAHRTASEGLVVIEGDARRMAMVELNCETDFVARNPEFQEMAANLARQALEGGAASADALKQAPYAGEPQHTVEQAISQKIATIGENMVLSSVALLQAETGHKLASYLHMGGRIGVVVEGSAGIPDEALRDVAMHVAASDPRFTTRDEVTAEILEAERQIALKQAVDQGKPEAIAARIVDGKMEKYFEQNVLPEQPYAKNPDVSVGEYLRSVGGADARVVRFVRFRLGESQ